MGDFFISTTELKAALESADPPAILDVRRRPALLQSGAMLPGASWRDPADVGQWAADLPGETKIVVYCVHGHEVSQGVGAALRDLGLQARVLEGGFEAWRTAGGRLAPAAGDRRT